jgi:glyoxylase-like metal-dependent hydrolase (beta-lactamase superfamily II)
MIRLETRAVPPFLKNGFVVWCDRTRAAALIDPGDEVSDLLDVVSRQNLTVKHILLTHAHLDHVTGVARAKAATSAPIWLHREDLFLYEGVVQQGAMFGIPVQPQPAVDHFYDVSQSITVGDLDVRVHHTPGHCPGGVCLQIGDRGTAGDDLFVGDTLFAGSIGRTDLPGGDYATLMHSIREVLFPLGDDARVHPGHGPMTTIRQEKATNPFVKS